ncbi:hypothetical protein EI94DRAFT_1810573 [Lactarius quietus]|nr:hypothetical protein EI94DRAFT_1810573 [Lactarius quietus]
MALKLTPTPQLMDQGPGLPVQDLKENEPSIQLSLKDHDTADARKASATKVPRSNPSTSLPDVKLGGPCPSNPASSASDSTSAMSKRIPGPIKQAASPALRFAPLEQLDTIESGDEEDHSVRSEVLREVEISLKDLERKALCRLKVTLVAEGAEPIAPGPSVVVPPSDADIDLFISEEDLLSPLVFKSLISVVAELGNIAAA